MMMKPALYLAATALGVAVGVTAVGAIVASMLAREAIRRGW